MGFRFGLWSRGLGTRLGGQKDYWKTNWLPGERLFPKYLRTDDAWPSIKPK